LTSMSEFRPAIPGETSRSSPAPPRC
jgi:hypothetical protein